MKLRKIAGLFVCLGLAAILLPGVSAVEGNVALANTNAKATAALNSIKTQSGFIPGQCGWRSWNNPNPVAKGWTNCKAGCWYFVANVEQRLVGCYPSGPSSYTLSAPGNFNKVGTITDTAKSNPSVANIKSLMLKAYPGDVIQFRSGGKGASSERHTAVVYSVDNNGITVYEHWDDPHHVRLKNYNWTSFTNSYLDMDAWTSYQKGITLYHYKNYASKFGNDPNPAPVSKMTLAGATYPTTLQKGKAFPVKGTITSPTKMTYVSAAVYNSAGKWMTGGSCNPNSTTYNLAGLDNKVVYNILAPGTYTYAVYAKNSSGQVCLLSQKFTVTSGYKAPYVSGANWPTSVKCGKFFGLKGMVYGNGSNLQQVTAAVYTAGGAWKTGKTINVNCGSVNIAKSLDPYVVFNHLPRGTYYYKVIAKNSAGTYTLVNKQFKVY